jgi:hypothetical protein
MCRGNPRIKLEDGFPQYLSRVQMQEQGQEQGAPCGPTPINLAISKSTSVVEHRRVCCGLARLKPPPTVPTSTPSTASRNFKYSAEHLRNRRVAKSQDKNVNKPENDCRKCDES